MIKLMQKLHTQLFLPIWMISSVKITESWFPLRNESESPRWPETHWTSGEGPPTWMLIRLFPVGPLHDVSRSAGPTIWTRTALNQPNIAAAFHLLRSDWTSQWTSPPNGDNYIDDDHNNSDDYIYVFWSLSLLPQLTLYLLKKKKHFVEMFFKWDSFRPSTHFIYL